ncbi:MAG TPA: hypothetical protein VFQ53_20520 [Kofleriaceae bacterium]|nr:hypothetical protein [Kofleriaceae bacterium]
MVVGSARDFLEQAQHPDAISFVDQPGMDVLTKVNHVSIPSSVVAIVDESLPIAVNWLQPNPWLSHVMSAAMLKHPMAEKHLENLAATLDSTSEPRLLDWLGPEVEGRRIRLTHASKRAERLERMGEFLEAKGVSPRATQQLRDAAEELVTNAFYDAPVTAGASKPISRTQDVELPEKNACDLAYGCRDDLAIVRVRDPFGSLSRRRLVEVLSRCAQPNMSVQVDESMGGAGLGMWRIFSNASLVAISVVKHRHTEILVGIAKRVTGPRPFAFHLFFRDGAKRRFWRLSTDTSIPAVNNSVMLELKSK